MEKNSELFKIEDRYCPICGNFIKAESPTHHCSKEYLKKLDKEEYEVLELDRTYDDKLNEFDEFYNSDNYYDNDTEDD
jgi:tRNA U54 and U55 pseudouridine synthase Pus10